MLMSKFVRRAGRWAAALVVVAAAAGCRPAARTAATPDDGVPLVITNHDYFDVGVYVQAAEGVQGYRIATVTGFSSAKVTVRRSLLERGSSLTLMLHAIGTAYSWTSPSIVLYSDDVARLDIYSDANGDLHRCAFYTRSM
ncbi:MAG TPA: hypothetical protein VHB25_04110 [Gemmatimonadaceae bacterium]|nr:hypothetical protein [Gemmatimonadaceae bacterium]